jgi:hypothetical protein
MSQFENTINAAYNTYSSSPNSYYYANVNPLFMTYTDFKEYNNIFNISDYFRNIISFTIYSQNSLVIDGKLQDLNTNDKFNDILSGEGIDLKADDNFGLDNNKDVYIQLQKNATATDNYDNYLDILNISKLIVDSLDTEFTNPSQLAINHENMKKYMKNIMSSCTFYYFKKIQSKSDTTSLLQTNTSNNIKDALMTFKTFLGSETQSQFRKLVDEFQSYFDKFIKDLGNDINQTNFLSNLLQNLGNGGTNDFKTVFYYSLRKKIISELLNGNNSSCQNYIKSLTATKGQTVANYVTKIITDVYLKSSYPLIQYQFIHSLMDHYMKKGDFLNTRFGLLAKIYLVIYTVSVLYLSLEKYNTDGKYTGNNLTSYNTTITKLNAVLVKLKDYLKQINDTNTAVDSEQQFGKILNNLKTLSNTVQSESSQINVIKNSIQNSSLEVRSILENMKIIDNRLKAKKIEFWIVFSFLLIFIITCIILIMIEQSLLVIYISAITILLVILYKLCLLVISLV